jgi:hypothetical protein
MNTPAPRFLLIAALGLGLQACSNDKDTETAQAQPLTRTESVEATMTSTVEYINTRTRVVTLRNEEGHNISFVVDDSVQRLDEVRVGDTVNVRYRATLVAELRPATSAEMTAPIVITSGDTRSPEGTTPAAIRARVTRIVTTVQAVDLNNMTVTLRGPMGDEAVVRGRSLDNLKKLNVGDTIVITTTRSVAVALEKAR